MRFRNNLLTGIAALKANFLKAKVPLSVMFSITNRCTSKCVYCDIPLRKQKELTTKEVMKLIEEMAGSGVQKLSLWGGEPLLRDDIGQVINYAKDKGMYVNIDSNGYLVPKRLDDIKNLDFLIMSFDGEKEYHDKNRETGAYDKFFRAVEAVNGKIPIWTLTVLTKNNINSVDFIIKKAKEHKFKTMFQVPYHPTGIGSGADLFAKPSEYKRVFDYLIELKKKGAPIISSTHYLALVADWPSFPATINNDRIKGFPKCWAGKLFCNIDTNGDMYPCSPMIEQVKPFNVLEEGFSQCFKKLREIQCYSCLSACSVEANLVFSFDILSIMEWFKYTSSKNNRKEL